MSNPVVSRVTDFLPNERRILMKIKIHASDLQRMLKNAKGLNLKSLSVENQKGLLIITTDDDITLIMNDLNIQLKSVVDYKIIEPGQVVIPESTLKLLENFKDDFLIITENEIKHGTKTIKYQDGDVNSFHKFTELITTPVLETTEAELNHLLEVSYATAKPGGTRPFTEGINIRDNRFISTNTYFISIRKGNFNTKENLTISQNMWKTLLKTVNKKSDRKVKVFRTDNLIKFVFADYEVSGKLIDDKFYDIDNILTDDYSTKITLNTKQILESLRLMKQLDSPVTLKLNDGLEIKAGSYPNVVTDTIKLESFEGQPLEIHFNIKYFYNVLNQYKNETVDIGFTSECGLIFVSNENKLEMLLPVRK